MSKFCVCLIVAGLALLLVPSVVPENTSDSVNEPSADEQSGSSRVKRQACSGVARYEPYMLLRFRNNILQPRATASVLLSQKDGDCDSREKTGLRVMGMFEPTTHNVYIASTCELNRVKLGEFTGTGRYGTAVIEAKRVVNNLDLVRAVVITGADGKVEACTRRLA